MWAICGGARLVLFGERSQIAEKDFGCQNVRRSDNDLPILGARGHLVGASHFRVAGTAHNEHDDARYILDRVLRLVLVPLSVTRTAAIWQMAHE